MFTRPILSTLALCAAAASPAIADRFPENTQGVWQTDGYGYVLEIRPNVALAHNVTGTVCVPNMLGALTIEMVMALFPIAATEDENVLHILQSNGDHAMWADRLDALPAACDTPTPNTPMGNFDAFAAFVGQHHTFLPLYNIDWAARVTHARTKVTPAMSDHALMTLMMEMMRDISDPHTMLGRIVDDEWQGIAPDMTDTDHAIAAALKAGDIPADLDLDEYFWNVSVDEQVLQGQGEITAGGMIHYGITGDNIGYIGLRGMYGFAGNDDIISEADSPALDAALDMILSDFAETDIAAVIVDISNNPGGDDAFSRIVASHFTEAEHHAYAKRPLDATRTEFSRFSIAPANGTRFTGPVYLMTSNMTYSAAEILTMSMRALPNVTHVGQKTGGGLSDLLSKELPNGWGLGLSNELYLDHEGTSWEGLGITPEIELSVFPANNLLHGHALAVETVADMAANN